MYPNRFAGSPLRGRLVAPIRWTTLALLCCLPLIQGCEKEEAKAGPAATPEVLVTKAEISQVPFSRDWVATLDGSTNVNVQARVQGYILSQNYTNGSVVKTGDLLFQIDPRPFEAALEQAKANVLSAQAAQVQAGLNEARQVQLYASRSVSEAERDQAVQANAAAKANVLAMQAAVEQAKLNLSFTKITSPVDGIAGIAKPGIGDLVGPSTGELCAVSTVDPIKAKFQLSEAEYMSGSENLDLTSTSSEVLNQIHLQLILGNGEIFPYPGKLSVLGMQVDPRTGTMEIQGLFPNPKLVLRPGFFGRVRMMSDPKPVILIPQRAVVDIQGQYLIYVVGKDNKVNAVNCEMGNRVGSDWVVRKGLKPGDTVVVEGVQTLRDGMTVKTKPFVEKDKAADGDQPTTATKSEGK